MSLQLVQICKSLDIAKNSRKAQKAILCFDENTKLLFFFFAKKDLKKKNLMLNFFTKIIS